MISIGDELLIGQTINTNAHWLGEQLSLIGAEIVRGSVIRDDKTEIINTLKKALKDVDVVIITGGLGPTKDDITKVTLTKYFNTELVLNNEVLTHVKSFFETRNKSMLEVNELQAHLPKNAKVLKNAVGTAPGMWFEKEGQVVISLPGVPYEMKHIIKDEVLTRLEKKFNTIKSYHQTIQLQGIGESYVADRIKQLESDLFEKGIKIAYLPSTSLIRIRFSGLDTQDDRVLINEAISIIQSELPNYFIGDDKKSLSEIVGELLMKEKMTLGTVESCTGGSVAHEIVQVSGSSQYFEGSFVSYSNRIKNELVGVSSKTLNDFGTVSKEVVEEMAIFGRLKLNVNYCISVSGIAGPSGGTETKKVGLVWIAIASENDVVSRSFQFGGSRERNIRSTVLTALNLLRCKLKGINIEKK